MLGRQKKLGIALITGLLLVPAVASAWRAQNRHEVFAIGDGVYEVLSRPGSGPADFWCAIGDYAVRQDRAAATQRIYIWRPIGASVTRGGYKAVQFAYRAPKGADTSTGLSLTVRRAGDNLSASFARNYCFDGGHEDDFIRRTWP